MATPKRLCILRRAWSTAKALLVTARRQWCGTSKQPSWATRKLSTIGIELLKEEKTAVQGIEWLRKAAEQNHQKAEFKLPLCLENGQGHAVDRKQAVEWYRKSAEHNNIAAQFNLAVCLWNGQGVEKNLSESELWYRKAAEQGDADAQYNFAICLANGQGVDKNDEQATLSSQSR